MVFLSPFHALLALLALPLLAAALVRERQAARVRAVLGLSAPPLRAHAEVALAVSLVALLALVASQPAIHRTKVVHGRTDAAAMLVVDVSRSMLAARDASAPTRLRRAAAFAARLGDELRHVPVGVASFTD